jgi:hypothetical protein
MDLFQCAVAEKWNRLFLSRANKVDMGSHFSAQGVVIRRVTRLGDRRISPKIRNNAKISDLNVPITGKTAPF